MEGEGAGGWVVERKQGHRFCMYLVFLQPYSFVLRVLKSLVIPPFNNRFQGNKSFSYHVYHIKERFIIRGHPIRLYESLHQIIISLINLLGCKQAVFLLLVKGRVLTVKG